MTKSCYQWQFQEPKLQVPTIYKAYFSGLREYPNNILPYMVLTYLHSRILKISHWCYGGIPLSPGPKTPVATRGRSSLGWSASSSPRPPHWPVRHRGWEWWVNGGSLMGDCLVFTGFFLIGSKAKTSSPPWWSQGNGYRTYCGNLLLLLLFVYMFLWFLIQW